MIQYYCYFTISLFKVSSKACGQSSLADMVVLSWMQLLENDPKNQRLQARLCKAYRQKRDPDASIDALGC